MGLLEDFGYWIASILGFHGQASEAVAFFVYDTIKVIFLLMLMVFLVSMIRTYVTRDRIKKWLGGRKEGIGNVLASLLGIPTPFCSCSAVPIFIGFLESGVPLGITFSFLIASPMINEIAIALLLGMFGWEITVLYIASGLVIAVIGGIIIGRLGLEKEIEGFVLKMRKKNAVQKKMTWKSRIDYSKTQTIVITKKVLPYIVLAIAVGAIIHGFVPVGFLSEIAGRGNPLAVPIAVLIGIPLYSNAAGTIPIVEALISKGMATGTALAFMMSITALSLPEMIILRKVMKPKLMAAFIAIIALSIMVTGLLFNFIIS